MKPMKTAAEWAAELAALPGEVQEEISWRLVEDGCQWGTSSGRSWITRMREERDEAIQRAEKTERYLKLWTDAEECIQALLAPKHTNKFWSAKETCAAVGRLLDEFRAMQVRAEKAERERDTLQRALNAVSAAIADAASVDVPNDEERYSDAVRQITAQRDTACAAVLELERKLAETRAHCEKEGKIHYKAALDWERNYREEVARREFTARQLDSAQAAENQLRTERDDWERACHNREDDLRGARHEAERYAAALERAEIATVDARQEADDLSNDLSAAMKVVEAARMAKKYAAYLPEPVRCLLNEVVPSFDARKNSGDSEYETQMPKETTATSHPELAGDFTALVKALRSIAKSEECSRWSGPAMLRMLADQLEKGGGDGE